PSNSPAFAAPVTSGSPGYLTRIHLWLFPRFRPSSDAAVSTGADQQSEHPKSGKGQRSESGRRRARLLPSVLPGRQGPGGNDTRGGTVRPAVRLKPDAENADGGGQREQGGQELAPPASPGEPCRDARREEERGAGKRGPA